MRLTTALSHRPVEMATIILTEKCMSHIEHIKTVIRDQNIDDSSALHPSLLPAGFLSSFEVIQRLLQNLLSSIETPTVDKCYSTLTRMEMSLRELRDDVARSSEATNFTKLLDQHWAGILAGISVLYKRQHSQEITTMFWVDTSISCIERIVYTTFKIHETVAELSKMRGKMTPVFKAIPYDSPLWAVGQSVARCQLNLKLLQELKTSLENISTGLQGITLLTDAKLDSESKKQIQKLSGLAYFLEKLDKYADSEVEILGLCLSEIIGGATYELGQLENPSPELHQRYNAAKVKLSWMSGTLESIKKDAERLLDSMEIVFLEGGDDERYFSEDMLHSYITAVKDYSLDLETTVSKLEAGTLNVGVAALKVIDRDLSKEEKKLSSPQISLDICFGILENAKSCLQSFSSSTDATLHQQCEKDISTVVRFLTEIRDYHNKPKMRINLEVYVHVLRSQYENVLETVFRLYCSRHEKMAAGQNLLAPTEIEVFRAKTAREREFMDRTVWPLENKHIKLFEQYILFEKYLAIFTECVDIFEEVRADMNLNANYCKQLMKQGFEELSNLHDNVVLVLSILTPEATYPTCATTEEDTAYILKQANVLQAKESKVKKALADVTDSNTNLLDRVSELAAEVIELTKQNQGSRIGLGVAGIASSGLVVAGFVSAFFTFGVGLGLSVGGAALGVGSGFGNLAADKIISDKKKAILEAMKKIHKDLVDVLCLVKDLQNELQPCIPLNLESVGMHDYSRSDLSCYRLAAGIWKILMMSVSGGKGIGLAARGIAIGADGLKALGAGAKAIGGVGVALAGVSTIIDTITIVDSAIDLAKNKKDDVATNTLLIAEAIKTILNEMRQKDFLETYIKSYIEGENYTFREFMDNVDMHHKRVSSL